MEERAKTEKNCKEKKYVNVVERQRANETKYVILKW